MAGEPIEIVRRATEAYNRQDWEELARFMDPQIEFQRPGGLGVIEGREAVIEHMKPDVLESQRGELTEITARGETVVAELTVHARGTGSGIELSQRIYVVWRIRDGRAVRFESYTTRGEALAAAGMES